MKPFLLLTCFIFMRSLVHAQVSNDRKISVTKIFTVADTTVNIRFTTSSPFVKTLQDVTVIANNRKPLVTIEDDKIIYNAEEDQANLALNTLDLLRKVPFVSVDGEDGIRLNGQMSFKILLNGRETGMFANNPANALKAFPGRLVKRIEVITNPSARYDAEGIGGLINIVTVKKVVGYNGYVGVNYSKFNTIPFAGINLKYGKFGLSGSGGYNKGITPDAQFYSETISSQPVAYDKRFSEGVQTNSSLPQWGNIEASLDLDSLRTISLYGGISGGHGSTSRETNYNLLFAGTTDVAEGRFTYYSKYQNPVNSWGLDYIHKFKADKNRELSLKYYFQYGKNNGFDTAVQAILNSSRYTINNNRSNDRQQTFQADYVHPLPKAQKLETGVKLILRNATAYYQNYFHNDISAPYKLIEANSDDFNYTQQVYSIYSTYRFAWKKLSFRLGARVERTDINGNFKNAGSPVKQGYNNLLPNIYLSKQFKNVRTLFFSYSVRLARPYIYNLNPFVRNTDSLNISYGNPNLKPQSAHNFELGYSLVKGNTSLNLRLAESYATDQIIRYSIFDSNTGITSTTYGNIGSGTITGLTVNLSTRLSQKWYLYVNATLQYVSVKNRSNAAQTNSGFSGNGSINTGYSFTSRFNTSVFLWFSRAPVSLQSRFSANYTFTWNAGYQLIKDKLNASLTLNNPFPTNFSVTTNTIDESFLAYSKSTTQRRAVGISVNWNFGKLSENVSRKKGVKNDDLKEKD